MDKPLPKDYVPDSDLATYLLHTIDENRKGHHKKSNKSSSAAFQNNYLMPVGPFTPNSYVQNSESTNSYLRSQGRFNGTTSFHEYTSIIQNPQHKYKTLDQFRASVVAQNSSVSKMSGNSLCPQPKDILQGRCSVFQ